MRYNIARAEIVPAGNYPSPNLQIPGTVHLIIGIDASEIR